MIDQVMLASDLEALLLGALSEPAFRRKYQPLVAASPLLDFIWGNLEHYLTDADIRARDTSYREFQDSELRKLIALLRADAPMDVLARVTFLSSS